MISVVNFRRFIANIRFWLQVQGTVFSNKTIFHTLIYRPSDKIRKLRIYKIILQNTSINNKT